MPSTFRLNLERVCEMLNLERIKEKIQKTFSRRLGGSPRTRKFRTRLIVIKVEIYLTIYRSLTEGDEVYFDRMEGHLERLEGVSLLKPKDAGSLPTCLTSVSLK